MANETTITSLELILTENINSVQCDFYRWSNEVWMTREQIGQALEYANPKKAIEKIHSAHRQRLDKYSKLMRWVSPNSGGTQETMCYSFEGTLETCRWSRQPKADEVMDALYAVFKRALTHGMISASDRRVLSEQKQLASHEKAIADATARMVKHKAKLIEELRKAIKSGDQVLIQGTIDACRSMGINVPDYDFGDGWDMGNDVALGITREPAVVRHDDGTVTLHMNEVVALNGETRTLEYWCKRNGLNRGNLRYRLERGMSVEDALTKPVQRQARRNRSVAGGR